jgi:hypothetical protein
MARRTSEQSEQSAQPPAPPQWRTPSTYSAGTVVSIGTKQYRCVVSHDAHGAFAVDLGTGKWVEHIGKESNDGTAR